MTERTTFAEIYFGYNCSHTIYYIMPFVTILLPLMVVLSTLLL